MLVLFAPLPCSHDMSVDDTDRAQLTRVPLLRGMEVMSAAYRRHAFPPHSHETFVIELVESGSDEFVCAGRRYWTEPGDIVVLNPGEVHTGRPHGSRWLHYRSFYPTPELLDALSSDAGATPLLSLRRIGSPAIREENLSAAFVRAHEACAANDANAVWGFRELFARLARYFVPSEPVAVVSERLHTARAILAARLAERVTLEEVSRLVHVSPFHLCREFRKTFGLPPHQFRLNARVEASRQLLKAGTSVSAAALATGFADQSHFTRHFKRIVGLTPGQFCLHLPG